MLGSEHPRPYRSQLTISLATIDRMVLGWRNLLGSSPRTTIVPGRPYSAETPSAICGRNVIWLREALELLFGTGLLTWHGEEPPGNGVTHWESEQEPLPTVNRRKAPSAERSWRYLARQAGRRKQSLSEPTEKERRQSLNLSPDFRASRYCPNACSVSSGSNSELNLMGA